MGVDAGRYHRVQLLLRLAGLALTLAYLVAFLLAGVAPAVARAATAIHEARWWVVATVAGVLAGGEAALTFPLSWVRGYWWPRRHGLLYQPLRGWLGDRLKASAISAALGLVTVEIVYALIAATPRWWAAASAVLVGFEVLLVLVFPVWLLPLFYRLRPLDNAALAGRLLELARRAGVSAIGVWVADQSRRSRTANAAVIGLGATRRVILFDTLIDRFMPREIETVLAHELAHQAHHDVWRGLGLQAVVTVAALWVADRLLHAGADAFGLAGPDDPAGMPWLALALVALGMVATPVINGISRVMERQADDFALALTGDVPGFVGAMEQLAELNLAERRPHPLKEFLLFSHPSIDRRIARAVTSVRLPDVPSGADEIGQAGVPTGGQ